MNSQRAPSSKRPCPDPLPIEPYFQTFRGSELFLRAVAESPSDDARRLVFSDWLEEQGASERAELIRLQVDLERRPDALRPAGQVERARELEARVGWRDAPQGVRMSRGLYSSFILSHDAHVDWCRKHRRAAGAGSMLLLLAQIRTVIDLQHLTIAVSVNPSDFKRLVNSPELSHLTSLQIAWNRISAAGAKAIATSSAFTHLDTLDLWDCGIGADGIRHLGGSAWASQLTSLNLGCNQLQDNGTRVLACSPVFENLTSLDLMCNEVTGIGVRELAESPFVKNLTSLNLFSNQIDDEGAEVLATSESLNSLTELDMRGNPVSKKSGRTLLARWPFAKV